MSRIPVGFAPNSEDATIPAREAPAPLAAVRMLTACANAATQFLPGDFADRVRMQCTVAYPDHIVATVAIRQTSRVDRLDIVADPASQLYAKLVAMYPPLDYDAEGLNGSPLVYASFSDARTSAAAMIVRLSELSDCSVVTYAFVPLMRRWMDGVMTRVPRPVYRVYGGTYDLLPCRFRELVEAPHGGLAVPRHLFTADGLEKLGASMAA